MKVMTRMWPLAPGIAVLHGSARHATAGVIQGSAGALLIDPGLFPGELYTLREQAHQWGGVQQVVATHSHWDRLPGWASFPDAERLA
ncbi:MAG: MBL fold metallo-hydrolase, partial [Chloroflexaceae bacterium]|nr:MBL fold metallo-hydrolase [Chloroflexaceae bacterium]